MTECEPITAAVRALRALGGAWREDWAGFDGRTLRAQLDDVIRILEGEEGAAEAFWEGMWLCDKGGRGHWPEHCGTYHPDPAEVSP